MKISTLVLSSLFFGLNSFAAGSGIVIGEIGYGGTGCVAGTVTADHVDSQVGSIHFSNFKLSVRKGTERKACNLVIPLDVPKGVQVGVGAIDEIDGFSSLPNSVARLTVNQEVFFAGSRGQVIPFVKKGNTVGPLKIENATSLKDLKWGACGQSVNLRVNLTASLVGNNRKLAFVSLDKLNLTPSGRLYWRACQ